MMLLLPTSDQITRWLDARVAGQPFGDEDIELAYIPEDHIPETFANLGVQSVATAVRVYQPDRHMVVAAIVPDTPEFKAYAWYRVESL